MNKGTPKEILSFVEENDVKFIRLTFTDIHGNLKNIAIMSGELERAFEHGIPFEAGFFSKNCSDLLLFPDISTMSVLPWRPQTGRVIRFFCYIKHMDGRAFEGDSRNELSEYICKMHEMGCTAQISTKCEFYLFDTDENGNPTKIPHDNAGYLDIAPLDKCENTRREICLSLEEMGFNPLTSRHSYGHGQNEIDFKKSSPVNAADNMVYYKTVVKNIAAQNGLFASFMPKPVPDSSGNGLHIGISIKKDGRHIFSSQPQNIHESMPETGKHFIAGVLNRISEITCFLNPTFNSYSRLKQNYSLSDSDGCIGAGPLLLRIPYTSEENPYIEIRTADALCNPYIAFRLILAAGFEGIDKRLSLLESVFCGNTILRENFIPNSLEEAVDISINGNFVKENLPKEIYSNAYEYFERLIKKYNSYEDKSKFEENYCFNIY